LGSLLSALGWFAVGSLGAALPAIANGASIDAWDLRLVAAPIVLGWAAQAIVGSAAHLLPAIGPGGPAAHRALRGALGRWWPARLAALNGGTALLGVGMVADGAVAAASGLLLAAGAIVATALLALASIVASREGRQANV
ncbi:MAG TPA: hypothetical protein VFI28_09505, partial [Candidatus Limnocylindrales bacterium]|nr:hypothetical protein [Candidatus Limnocylindrales bacterium]